MKLAAPIIQGATRVLQSWVSEVTRVWSAVTSSGTTAARPTDNLWAGRTYFDTTINQEVFWDGVSSWVTWGGGGGGGAPTGATYVTLSLDGTLTAERVLTAGANITITDGGPNAAVTIAAASGAPTAASYVLIANDATLTADRALAVSAPITLADGGANASVTLGWNMATALDNNARLAVNKNSGATIGTRRRLNLIEGANITLTISDDAINEEVDVTITASAGTAPTAGSVTVDFGFAAGGEGDIATASVALAAVAAGSKIQVTPRYASGLDHDPDDYAAESISATVGTITAGVGFDVLARAPHGTWGRYNLDYLVTV